MTQEEQLLKQKEQEDFKKSLTKKTYEELQKMEEEIVAEADKTDEEVAKQMYDLPTENYKVVAEAVRYFLDKQTVQWQYTLGLITMYEFWDPETKPKQINHPTLDATLRTLGEMQFTGYEEWAKVVAINKYCEPLRTKYVEVTTKVYDVATRHTAIVDELNKKTPIGDLSKKETNELEML